MKSEIEKDKTRIQSIKYLLSCAVCQVKPEILMGQQY